MINENGSQANRIMFFLLIISTQFIKIRIMKVIKKGIILEKIKANDLNALNFQYYCENCSYFIPDQKACCLGYKTKPHLKENQDKLYNQSGHLALCRFLEID